MTRYPLISASFLALALGGCEAQAPAPDATASAEANGPEVPSGVTVTDARVQLPVVAGRPGAAYFTVTSGEALTIAGASVDKAGRAEMHETRSSGGASSMVPISEVTVAPGQPVSFSPGGNHLMLFDLDPALKAGDTAELTLTFANGDKASVQAPVVAGGMEMAH